MADKIVILEDKDGNNVYPITRGLAANSVDTNAIQDGAVTSSKIDWTTLAITISIGTNATKTITFDPNCIYLILYTVSQQSGMWLVQARQNLLYVNTMTTPSGVSNPTYTTSGLTISITTGTTAIRVVSTKMMANVTW